MLSDLGGVGWGLTASPVLWPPPWLLHGVYGTCLTPEPEVLDGTA